MVDLPKSLFVCRYFFQRLYSYDERVLYVAICKDNYNFCFLKSILVKVA